MSDEKFHELLILGFHAGRVQRRYPELIDAIEVYFVASQNSNDIKVIVKARVNQRTAPILVQRVGWNTC